MRASTPSSGPPWFRHSAFRTFTWYTPAIGASVHEHLASIPAVMPGHKSHAAARLVPPGAPFFTPLGIAVLLEVRHPLRVRLLVAGEQCARPVAQRAPRLVNLGDVDRPSRDVRHRWPPSTRGPGPPPRPPRSPSAPH